MHKAAFGTDPVLANMLDAGGEYAWRVRGEDHMWSPDAIAKLQHATRANNWNTYKEYAQLINDQNRSIFAQTQLWGDEFGMCADRFGISWMVNIAGSPQS
jgi:glutamate synthase domain-containing protein 2